MQYNYNKAVKFDLMILLWIFWRTFIDNTREYMEDISIFFMGLKLKQIEKCFKKRITSMFDLLLYFLKIFLKKTKNQIFYGEIS